MCSTLLDLIFRSWKQKIIAKIERGGMQDQILKRYWYWVASFRKRWISYLFLNPIQWDYFCIQDFASVEAYWTLKFLVLSKMTLKVDWKGARRICEGMTWQKGFENELLTKLFQIRLIWIFRANEKAPKSEIPLKSH